MCLFMTDEEMTEAVKAVKEMEENLGIKFSKKEFDQMVLTIHDPLFAVENGII